MVATHLAYPDLAIDKISGTNPDQDAESFVQIIEIGTRVNLKLHDQNSLSLLTYCIYLPLESKQCPLRPASVLAWADSLNELRF